MVIADWKKAVRLPDACRNPPPLSHLILTRGLDGERDPDLGKHGWASRSLDLVGTRRLFWWWKGMSRAHELKIKAPSLKKSQFWHDRTNPTK